MTGPQDNTWGYFEIISAICGVQIILISKEDTQMIGFVSGGNISIYCIVTKL